jgi:hypothetical protein
VVERDPLRIVIGVVGVAVLLAVTLLTERSSPEPAPGVAVRPSVQTR